MSMATITKWRGYTFYAEFDFENNIWSIYTEEDKIACIGEFDTLAQAYEFIPEWIEEQKG